MEHGSAAAAVAVMPKALPPIPPEGMLPRPRVEALLHAALRRQVCVVVAHAGYGKTTAVLTAVEDAVVTWYHLDPSDRLLARFVRGLVGALRLQVPALAHSPLLAAVTTVTGLGPEADADEERRALAAAGAIAEALRSAGRTDLVLVLDDLHELGDARGPLAFVQALCRQGAGRLVVTSRTPLPFPLDRLRGQGALAEIGPTDLAFTEPEAADLLADWGGADLRALAPRLHALTGGWPVGLRLAAEALARARPADHEQVIARLGGSSGTLQRYLLEEVLAHEHADTQQLVEVLAALPETSAEVAAALGVRDARLLLEDLERRGLYLQPGSQPGWVRPAPLIREVMTQGIAAQRLEHLRADALAWLDAQGPPAQALAVAVALGGPALRDVVQRQGAAALAAGRGDLVVAACSALPAGDRGPEIERLHGEALQGLGRWEEALACYAAARADADGPLPAGLAWREGLIHYFRGSLQDAAAVFDRAQLDGSSAADEALLLAWRSAACWRLGRTDEAGSAAEESFARASAAADPRALAAAHTALAMVAAARGDRRANDVHYLQALEHAERAGDTLQVVRIRTNRSSLFLEEGAFEAAVAEADAAVALADLSGYAAFHSLALVNRAEAQIALGRLDDAHTDLRTAEAIEQDLRSTDVRYPLLRLGDLHRVRGNRGLARTAYAEALHLSEEAGDRQVMAPVLAGLARILADDDPPRAAELAERAVALGEGMERCGRPRRPRGRPARRRCHRGGAGNREAGTGGGGAPARASRPRRGAGGRRASCSSDPVAGLARLDEARAIWQELGSPGRDAPLRSSSAGLRSGGRRVELLAEHAESELRALGAHGAVGRCPGSASPARPWRSRSLGGFRVVRDGGGRPGHGLAVPEGPRPAEDARGATRPSGSPGGPDDPAVARRGA
jgi:ATP/maltotriose-dependent transcriptional regulator MalT